MKISNILTISTIFAISSLDAVVAGTGSLTIEMLDLQSSEGQAVFVVMDSETSHHGKTPVYIKSAVSIEQGEAHIVLNDMPAGHYSAVIYHDINSNGELDNYFFGMPREPYGFSNNARNKMGIPTFSESRFEISSNQATQKISVK